MKYPCNLIIDLLPLYHDDVCSAETSAIIEEHLLECHSCKMNYEELFASDVIVISTPKNPIDSDEKRTESFKSVRKRIAKKQVLISILSITLLLVIAFLTVFVIKNTNTVVPFQDNISVYREEGNLVARLSGNVWKEAQSITVSVEYDGKVETYLFFSLSSSAWNKLVSDTKTLSEYTVAYHDKGAGIIDFVYYYQGDYSKLKNDMDNSDIKSLIQEANLLWSR